MRAQVAVDLQKQLTMTGTVKTQALAIAWRRAPDLYQTAVPTQDKGCRNAAVVEISVHRMSLSQAQPVHEAAQPCGKQLSPQGLASFITSLL